MGDLDPYLTRDSLGPSEPKTQTASRSVLPFLQRGPQSVPILYNGTPLRPLKIPLPMGDLDPHRWFLGVTRVLNPNGISIGAAVFAGLTSVTDRPTDRPTDHSTRPIVTDRVA